MNKDILKAQELTELVFPKLVKDLAKWVQIDSVYDEETVSKTAPFGKNVKKSLAFFKSLAKKDGFEAVDIDNKLVELTYNEKADKSVVIMGHADVVPTGNGWKDSPFSAVIKDNKLYGRGSIDD
ncbi:MAG: M20/M25/M40 family metallo-hydrolase, partial [Bacillales bacterium]|nr:M20/M25/M40 family metallo-hydrolase [Bacillales bacterium]